MWYRDFSHLIKINGKLLTILSELQLILRLLKSSFNFVKNNFSKSERSLRTHQLSHFNNQMRKAEEEGMGRGREKGQFLARA